MSISVLSYPGAITLGLSISTDLHDGHNHRDIPAFWQRVATEQKLRDLPGHLHEQGQIYGVMYDYDPVTTSFRYAATVPVAPGTVAPEGYEIVSVPAGRYAVYTTQPARDQAEFGRFIAAGWQEIMQRWLPQSGEQMAYAPSFELYADAVGSDLYGAMQIWVPLQD
ncbi:AraC family transcriptional regulator [Andreprevotia lacus DSM 23236]|uniref:AraC family transcriptional regulator n=1 Tax=Andreprevotia lacus DSM 23236 TaxID=1121001 RepID=A0A1W1X584_9NEIS|nr:GyrI-like domain-containing protein [Andreprevotia lacus]SMC19109.1 AraC family transcriptional regulator [Andreprevotia lacus DSM 23236]